MLIFGAPTKILSANLVASDEVVKLLYVNEIGLKLNWISIEYEKSFKSGFYLSNGLIWIHSRLHTAHSDAMSGKDPNSSREEVGQGGRKIKKVMKLLMPTANICSFRQGDGKMSPFSQCLEWRSMPVQK